MSSKKQTIAVDIDDVLAATAPGFIEFSNKRWKMDLTIDDYDENWMRVWGVDAKELVARTAIIKNEFWQSVQHSEEARPVLKRLADKYKLVITTSRRREVNKPTKDWIDKYFGGIFKEIHHSGIYDVDKHDLELYQKATRATKAELCKEIGADYLIDDHIKHCLGADAVGVVAILFGDYHWSRGVEIPDSIICLRSWKEIGKYFADR